MRIEEEGLDGYDYYEGQPKWPLRRVIKTILYGISAVVYAILLIRIATSCNSAYQNMILLNDKAAELYYYGNGGTVLRVDFATEENEEGSVIPQGAVYLADCENFQLTLKIRKKHLPPSSEGCGYDLELRGLFGEETKVFPVSYEIFEDRFGYRYVRAAFEGVELDSAEELVIRLYQKGDSTQPLFSYQVYTGDTYCKKITPGKSEYQLLDS